VTEVTGIGEVGVALAACLERRQIQHVEDVEKIGAKVQGSQFSEMHEAGKQGVLAQRHVNLTVAGPAETVASNAIRPAYFGCNAVDGEIRARSAGEYVEVIEPAVRVRRIFREDTINKSLI